MAMQYIYSCAHFVLVHFYVQRSHWVERLFLANHRIGIGIFRNIIEGIRRVEAEPSRHWLRTRTRLEWVLGKNLKSKCCCRIPRHISSIEFARSIFSRVAVYLDIFARVQKSRWASFFVGYTSDAYVKTEKHCQINAEMYTLSFGGSTLEQATF